MNYLEKLVGDIEIQSVEGIRECFENGISPNDLFRNKPLIYEVITEYPRGPKFKECIKAFVDYGLEFEDKAFLYVLLDSGEELDKLLTKDKEILNKKYSFDCAFTQMLDASLLHICAEFNHLACAKVLVKYGLDVNIKAGTDAYGFGGQTPIFHTVNQHENKCIDLLHFLLSQSADVQLTIKGLIWGKHYEWETFIPSVNPISYAMMGLLRQFQRKEELIYEIVTLLMKAAYNINYYPKNIPNKYLSS